MTGNCIVQRLPKNSIIEGYSKKNKNGKLIRSYMAFADWSTSFEVRPKAASFADRYNKFFPIYLVLYNDTQSTRCLFLFTFTSTENKENIFQICRCVGKTSVKRHWAQITNKIMENIEEIKNLTSGAHLPILHYDD